ARFRQPEDAADRGRDAGEHPEAQRQDTEHQRGRRQPVRPLRLGPLAPRPVVIVLIVLVTAAGPRAVVLVVLVAAPAAGAVVVLVLVVEAAAAAVRWHGDVSVRGERRCYQSEPRTSPPFRVTAARSVCCDTDAETNRTDPSAIATLDPFGCDEWP